MWLLLADILEIDSLLYLNHMSLDSVSEFIKFLELELWYRPQYVC